MSNEQKTVLLVEDNKDLSEINRRSLVAEGWFVETAFTLAQARDLLQTISPEVILLDVALPDGNGMDFCGEIRQSTDAHILFLTSRTEHEDKLKGLGVGGDDYITKPYKLDELLARVNAAMRRREINASVKTLTKGSLTLNLVASLAFVSGKDLRLTPKEFALLRLLAEREGQIISSERLYEKVWNAPSGDDVRAVKFQIYNLRRKLENSGYSIVSMRGAGYCFEEV